MTMMIKIMSVIITMKVIMMMMNCVHLVEGTREGGVVRGEDRGEQKEQPPEWDLY